jgi:tetratricopeptide (TPR) repeat protein
MPQSGKFFIILFLGCLASVRLAMWAGNLTGNVGTVALNRATVNAGELWSVAEIWLQRAALFSDMGWRGLGFVYAGQGEETAVLTTWQHVENMALEATQWAALAHERGATDDVQLWAGRAVALDPDLSDGWYWQALAYEVDAEYATAVTAYHKAIEQNAFVRVGASQPHYQLGLLYQMELVKINEAVTAYKMAVSLNQFPSQWQAANAYYRLGEALAQVGADPVEVIAAYERAIELNPDHAAAYVLLGMAYDVDGRGLTAVTATFHKAMSLDAQNPWAFTLLGEIYARENRPTEAAALFNQALLLDPHFERAAQGLQAVQP